MGLLFGLFEDGFGGEFGGHGHAGNPLPAGWLARNFQELSPLCTKWRINMRSMLMDLRGLGRLAVDAQWGAAGARRIAGFQMGVVCLVWLAWPGEKSVKCQHCRPSGRNGSESQHLVKFATVPGPSAAADEVQGPPSVE